MRKPDEPSVADKGPLSCARTAHGAGVLAKVRVEEPSTYLPVAFSTIPKDAQITIKNRGPMDSEEMRKIRRLVEIIDACVASGTDSETVFAGIEEICAPGLQSR